MGQGSRSLVASAAVALFVLCACSVSTGAAGGDLKIATASVRSDAYNLALFEGTLSGRANGDGTACLYVGATALMWPYGYTAGGEPLTVFDESGRAVATVGQHVSFAGGLLPENVHALTGCDGFNDFWGVGHVEEARWP